MSFYIGDAHVHDTPFAVLAQEEAELQAEIAAIRRAFGQLAREILILVINAILRAMGLSNFAGPLDSAVNALENALLDIPKGNVTGLVDSLSTIGGDIAYILQELAKALVVAGVADLKGLVGMLRGLLPAAIPNFDGTAQAAVVPGFTALGNGTVTYIPQQGVDAVSHLIQQADGTVVTAAHAVQQAVQTAAAVSAANIGTAVAAGQQVVDHAVAALTGSFNVGQPAQALGFHLGAHLTGVFNAKTGASVPVAASADIIAAEEQAAAAAAAQAQQTAAINAQLPHFYGGSGAAGNNFSVQFPGGTLPSSFTAINTTQAIFNSGQTLTDQQTVSAIWTSTLAANEARYLYLRANSALTTFVYLKVSMSGDPGAVNTGYTYHGYPEYTVNDPNAALALELGCYVAGVQTVFQTWKYPMWTLVQSVPAEYTPIAGYNYWLASAHNLITLEATANVFALSYQGGLGTLSVTDGSNVSQIGSSYRNGGYSDSSGLPGSQLSWDFYDSGPVSGPASAVVSTTETTTSTTYADLATTTDQVTVNVGSSGLLVVFINSFVANGTFGNNSCISIALSGANTLAAADARGVFYQQIASGTGEKIAMPIMLTGLLAGATTVKMKYRVTAGTGTFQDRRIDAIPL
jgi:hypothetical protein